MRRQTRGPRDSQTDSWGRQAGGRTGRATICPCVIWSTRDPPHSWAHRDSERVSTLPAVTQPAISRARNTPKIKRFLILGAFFVNCGDQGGLPEHFGRSLSAPSFQKIRSCLSFALPRCSQNRPAAFLCFLLQTRRRHSRAMGEGSRH